MCKYTSHEQYTTCNHTIPCHLKYDINYCHSPNGIPLPTPAVSKLFTERGFCPSRCCDMDKWKRTVLRVHGWCPACVTEARQRAGAEALGAEGPFVNTPEVEGMEETGGYWEMRDRIRWFECGHSKAWVTGESLQKCFHYKGDSDDDYGEEQMKENKKKKKKKKKKNKKSIEIGEDVEIDMGDLRIAEFWETEYLFSEEEAEKIQFENYHAEGICGRCWFEELSKEEEGLEKDKKWWPLKSRRLFGWWKQWMKSTFQERTKKESWI